MLARAVQHVGQVHRRLLLADDFTEKNEVPSALKPANTPKRVKRRSCKNGTIRAGLRRQLCPEKQPAMGPSGMKTAPARVAGGSRSRLTLNERYSAADSGENPPNCQRILARRHCPRFLPTTLAAIVDPQGPSRAEAGRESHQHHDPDEAMLQSNQKQGRPPLPIRIQATPPHSSGLPVLAMCDSGTP